MTSDPRLIPARDDLAAAHLRGTVEAARYADPTPMTVVAPVLDMLGQPTQDAPLTNQLLFGEGFTAYEIDTASGFAWGQADEDGYVGYVPAQGLRHGRPAPTLMVATTAAQTYAQPQLKTRPLATLPALARVEVDAEADGYVRIADGGFVARSQLVPLGQAGQDYVTAAERFLGAPYVWGGRSSFGLDCSALVQLALMAVGRAAPRDSDMQLSLGRDVDGRLERGDLVFWKGHVGIMLDGSQLLHANANYMACVSEPLAEAESRIALTDGPITARRRIGTG